MPNNKTPSVTLHLNKSTGRWHANVFWSNSDRQRQAYSSIKHSLCLIKYRSSNVSMSGRQLP
jgi:hypothetical protein